VPIPASVDATCRAWCANEPEGSTCGVEVTVGNFYGGGDTIQHCYEGRCLPEYQSAPDGCRDEWIGMLQCHVDLECDDIFGDCDETYDAYQECTTRAANREFCTANCPHLDPNTCELDRSECETFLQANNHCESACPTQNRDLCIEQYTGTGHCDHEEAVSQCRSWCTAQDLTECVSQWLETERCEFSDASAACNAVCPDTTAYYCVDYWEENGTCPDPDDAPVCLDAASRCSNGTVDAITSCCNPGTPPTQENACTGTESLVNPTSCTATGNTVTHQLTVMTIAGDCNVGYNLDSCDGSSCVNGGLAPGEGANAVDNALAGLAAVLSGVGGSLSGVNQVLSDGLCGVTDVDENPQTGDSGCETPIDAIDIEFVVDTNAEENCANVTVSSGGATTDVILNISEPAVGGTFCASGTIGTIPVTIAGETGALGNTVIRMTVSESGFSDGLLGATLGGDTAVAIAEAIIEGGGAVVAEMFDINADLSGDISASCDALSATFDIAGVARLRNLVYCENPEVAAPSCGLVGYALSDDSALRAKLEGCAIAGCHADPSPTFTLDLSAPTLQETLSALTLTRATNGDYLVDELDPDCSNMLTKLTDEPAGGLRMPSTGVYWSTDEIDCFRSYLHELYPQSASN
jgi:hypothetical protein